jgi:hypothetical protein
LSAADLPIIDAPIIVGEMPSLVTGVWVIAA